jgi:hypothetical protein
MSADCGERRVYTRRRNEREWPGLYDGWSNERRAERRAERSFRIGKARQLIKVCRGLRGDENNIKSRLIHDDPTLMEMDAPVCIPTGQMRAYNDVHGHLLFVSEEYVVRP